MLGNIFSIFFLLLGFDFSLQLSPKEKKNINLSCADFAQRVVKINEQNRLM